MRIPRPLLFALVLGLSACSMANGLDASAGYDSGPRAGTNTSTATDSGLTTTTNAPSLFAIDGNLAVNNEDVELDQSTLTMEYRNAEGDTVCEGTLRVLTSTTTVANTDPDLPLYGWWDLVMEPSLDCPFGPDALTLGIGAWDPSLDAAATASNLDGSDLYALYVQLAANAPVFVFGAAGTSEQFSGTTPPVTEAPLPDGLYQLQTLYLLSVDAP